MPWIALACLLALTSSAFGRSTYGSSYGQQKIPSAREYSILSIQQQDASVQQKLHNDDEVPISSLTKTVPVQGYDATSLVSQTDQHPIQVLDENDILCRGQSSETVIPLDDGRRFVVCVDDGKGFEQQCPTGLHYDTNSRRCERKLSPLENPCSSQPCLNNGQCVQTDVSSYQCQCAPSFDGRNCGLDARVCQKQQPCGQSPDARCQSFRLDSALPYICIFQDGLAYGLNAQQAKPSPCQGVDGVHALLVSEKGFIMCDGEDMFVESCPGGTIWDDVNKACTWPDMRTNAQLDQQQDHEQSSYGQQQTMNSKSDYDI